MRPSSSVGSLRRQDSAARNMYLLSASASSASIGPFDPETYAKKIARIRELNSQADLLAESMLKQGMLTASQRVLLPRRRPASAAVLPQLALKGPPKVNRIPQFINAPRKTGVRPGYVYKIGPKGAGYYVDPTYKGKPDPRAPAAEPTPVAALVPQQPVKQLTHEEKFQQEKELKDLRAMAENGLNSRFTDMFKAFQYLDLDRSGRLSRQEIARGLDLWNIPMDDRKLDLLLGDCDQDGDGGVSYEEFVDKLARETVTTAAMGKRGMQSLEAMGVDSQEMLAEQLGHKKLAKFKPSLNK